MTGIMVKRVMVFGRPGSGKSTFAAWLSRSLGLPLHHLDQHFYVHHWVERDYNEFLYIQKNIVDTDCWIVDGNNTRSFEMRWARADLILYFNFSKLTCYFRVVKRFFNQKTTLNDRAPGCKETIRYSLLKYMWHFERRVSEKIKLLKKRYPNAVFKEIRCDRDLNQLRQQLVGSHESHHPLRNV